MPMQHPLDRLTIRQLLGRLFGMPQVVPRIKLHEAAKQGNEDVVRQAIESNSELDESDQHGRGVLQLAASSGCSEIFVMLLEAGATPTGPLIPPVSLADFCFVCSQLASKSLIGLLSAWLASKLYIPIPSFMLRNLSAKLFAQLIAIPALYWFSYQWIFWSYPKVFSKTRSIIEALSTFKGDTECMIVTFLDSITDVSDLDDEEILLLWSHAVKRGYTSVCQRQLRSGIAIGSLYVNDEYPDIITALFHACGASHRELVLLLLSNGADPTLMDNYGRSCLIMASARPYSEYAGSIEDSDAILEVLLKTDAIQYLDTSQNKGDSGFSDLTLPGRDGWPLIDACKDLRGTAVRMLLEAGANPNLKTESGWTALHRACYSHVPEIVRLLVRYGADVNAVTDLGWTPLGCASSIATSVEVIDILVQAGAQLESTAGAATSLQVAARHDVSGGEVIRYLAQKGADVNAVGDKFGSVLLATLERPFSFVLNDDGSIKMEYGPQAQIIDFILEFLDHGLDVNLVPEGRSSPLEVAAQKNLPLVVSFLLQHGAELPVSKGKGRQVRYSDQSQNTSVLRKVRQTSILSQLQPYNHEIFRILLEHGVSPDVDAAEDSEMTILGSTCASTNERYLITATLLLEHGADPNFRDTHGHLPIQRAAYAVSLAHLHKLVEYGASLIIDDSGYGTLLHSLCKGYSKKPDIERNSQTFLDCFRYLDQKLPYGSVWRQDGASRHCLHYIAEISEETFLTLRADGTLLDHQSPAVSILVNFLSTHGHPHPLERIPTPSLEMILAQDSYGLTVFHIASQRGDLHVMHLLVKHFETLASEDSQNDESNENIIFTVMTQPDKLGWNSLHHAASKGRALACQYILTAIEPKVVTTLTILGESVQDLANKSHHYGIADYITAFVEEHTMKKAESILASIVGDNLHLGFTEDQLLDAIGKENERHSLLRHL